MTDDLTQRPEEIGEETQRFMSVIEALTGSESNDTRDIQAGEIESTALLVCREKSVQKWAVRWFQHAGFRTAVVTDPAGALETARALDPAVIVVEAWLKDAERQPVFKQLLDAHGPTTPIFVLSASAGDTKAALDAGIFDIARKPFDWQLLSRRAKAAATHARQEADLKNTRESLESAMAVADDAREQLHTSVSFEPVTGLPNRTKFLDLLERGIKSVAGGQNALVAMVVGLNRFNQIAEALGQHKSDAVASSTAQALNACLQVVADAATLDHGLRTASVARIAPGRFAIMMTCAPDSGEVDALRREALERLSQPVVVDGQTLFLSPCVGAALYPRDVADATQLLLKAESAMRDARASGVQFRYHDVNLEADVARKLQIEHRLHGAIEKSELQLAYQPLVDVASDRIVGCEALLRWPQADGSFLSPAEFVPIAESSGLMVRIGEFVLDTACQQLAAWQEQGLGSIRVSVNVSKCQLVNDGFPQLVDRCLRRHDVDPGLLDLELNERGVLSGSDDLHGRLHELKQLGVSLSIDDFGTGDAAIAYLKDLPVDVLKIDRSYVMELTSQGNESAITSAMVALGQKLKLTVVAEGVETPEQLAALRAMGCDQYQGFYCSPAVSPDALVELIRKGP